MMEEAVTRLRTGTKNRCCCLRSSRTHFEGKAGDVKIVPLGRSQRVQGRRLGPTGRNRRRRRRRRRTIQLVVLVD